MTDPDPSADRWTATLLQMQQELLQRWLKTSAAPAEVAGLFDGWSKLATQGAPGLPPSMQQSAAAWEQFFGLGRAVLQSLAGGDASPADAASRARSFAGALNAWFEQLGSKLAQQPNFFAAPDAMQWWRMLMQGPASSASAARATSPAMGFAALGLTRERQEAWQRFARLLEHHQQILAKLAQQWVKIGADASKEFAARVSAAGDGAPPRGPQSVKGLYDLWIDCAEGAYGAVAHSPEYSQLIAALANSSNALRVEQQRELESWARQFDLPTRAELNALQQQVKQLRAQLRTQSAPASTPSKKPVTRRKPRAKK
jgi:hypothetical protein